MTHTSTHTTPYLRHYTNITPDSSTHTRNHIIRVNAELVTLNAHNIYIHRPLNSITTLAAWKT
jgi:hypothetical protein